MNDLGYLPPKKEGESAKAQPVTIVSPDEAERKPSYPSFNLNGEQAKKAGLSKCAHGDEYEITLRIRATRIGGWGYMGSSDEKDSPSMEFDVVSAGEPKEVSEASTDGESEEQDDTKPPQRKPKQSVKEPKDFDL